MRAVCWQGPHVVRVEDVPEPRILNPRDAIVKVSSTAICGSDLHIYNGEMPSMQRGDVLGHEFMGEVIAIGSGIKNLREGDRVVVPSVIACGFCLFCKRREFANCGNSNPNAQHSMAALGVTGCGLFGSSHTSGGYAGGQAEMVRVPFANIGPIKVPEVPDESVLFLSDTLPTGWAAAESCHVQPGDVVAVWGCGSVGQFAVRSLFLLGAHRVIAIDRVQARLDLAGTAGAETLNFESHDVVSHLLDMTGGRGPDACVDAVGMSTHETGPLGVVDRVKQAVGMQSSRAGVMDQMIRSVGKGGRISIVGTYARTIDGLPIDVALIKGVTIRLTQVHIRRYSEQLLDLIASGKLDPTVIISDTLPLEQAADGYKRFDAREAGCIKVVLKPGAISSPGMNSQPERADSSPLNT